MVSWGLGHNLEKNLQKARALREKGEDRQALDLLLNWAEKHEDSPHYLFEAALTAFDLEDPASGLNSIKTLLRRFPDTRDKILGACGDHFSQRPNLPLAEFLIDDHAAARRLVAAFEVIDKVSPREVEVYAKRVAMRHQSLAATPNTPDAKVLQIQVSRLVAAHANGDAAIFADATRALLDLDPELSETLNELCEAEDPRQRPEIALARGCCRAAAGQLRAACQDWTHALQQNSSLAAQVRELLAPVDPPKKERGRWLATRAHASLALGENDSAADLYSEACEADASLREEILETLVRADEETRDSASLAKLRLRLFVVLHQAEEAAQYSRELRQSGVIEVSEIRRLMVGSGDEAEASALTTALAEAAIFDQDLGGAAEQANAISDRDVAALRRLLDAIDSVRSDWPEDTRISLLSFGAVLAARAKDGDRCNEILREIWEHPEVDATTAISVTGRCLEVIKAQRSFLLAAGRALLDRDADEVLREIIDRIFGTAKSSAVKADPAPAIDGFQSVDFEDAPEEGLQLDVDGLDQEAHEDLEGVFLLLVEEKSSRSQCLLRCMDACAPSVDAAQRFRHPIAYAALLAGDFDRGLSELAVLQVTGGEDMADTSRRHLEAALREHPEAAVLRAALAELLMESGDLLGAGTQLGEALRQNPAACDELCSQFDRLLEREVGPESGALWITYAQALFDIGRFGPLRAVCERGRPVCDDNAASRLELLATRVLVEEGRLTEALQAVQRLLRRTDEDSERIVNILQAILDSHPGSAGAHFLMGEACYRAGRPADALEAWSHAAKCDDSLSARVAEKIQVLEAHPAVSGHDLFRMACYHAQRQQWSDAARLLEQAVRVDPEIAARILGEFEAQATTEEADLDLVLALADAARVAGRPEFSCELLSRVDQHDGARIEAVLTGFRRVRDAYREDLEAVVSMARVLLRHRMIDAAALCVSEAGADAHYDPDARRSMLAEFHRRCPDQTQISLTLAERCVESERWEEALEILEESITRREADVDRAHRIVQQLRAGNPGMARIALLEHDYLLRAGRVEDALRALPLSEAVTGAELHELTSRLETHREVARRHLSIAENYGRALWKQGRHMDSLDILRSAVLELQPEATATIRWTLAELLVQSDLAEEAGRVLALDDAASEVRRKAYQHLAAAQLDRLDAEIASLEDQRRRHPGAAHLVTRLARRLLDRGRCREAEEVLIDLEGDDKAQIRRGILLAEARLELGRADRAETALRGLAHRPMEARQQQRVDRLLAQCAERLVRPAEARARYQKLESESSSPTTTSTAARQAYTHDLADVAGEFRAVLIGVGDLDTDLHPLQEQS